MTKALPQINELGAPQFDKQNEGGVRSTLLLLRNFRNHRNAEMNAAAERAACFSKHYKFSTKHHIHAGCKAEQSTAEWTSPSQTAASSDSPFEHSFERP